MHLLFQCTSLLSCTGLNTVASLVAFGPSHIDPSSACVPDLVSQLYLLRLSYAGTASFAASIICCKYHLLQS